MNKAELSENIAGIAQITKAEASKVIDIITVSIIATLRKGNRVSIKGFGSFVTVNQEARNRRNPQTGSLVKIGATKKARFIAGKAFVETMQL